MGNWDGAPDTYAYQWALDGVNAGDGTATYVFVPGDVGKTATCTVSATNASGTTTAPPSNQVMIAPAAGGEAASVASAEMHAPPPPKKEEPKAEEPPPRRNHR
jgi:hypothetical protein